MERIYSVKVVVPGGHFSLIPAARASSLHSVKVALSQTANEQLYKIEMVLLCRLKGNGATQSTPRYSTGADGKSFCAKYLTG